MWKANKLITVLLWGLAVISVGLCFYVFIKSGQLNTKIPEDQDVLVGVIDPLFIWVYILVAITALLAVFLPLPQVAENPKSAAGILVGLLGFVAVVGLSYLFANSEPLPFTPGHAPVGEGIIKFADVNLIAVYIMLLATILVTIGTSIWNVFKLR